PRTRELRPAPCDLQPAPATYDLRPTTYDLPPQWQPAPCALRRIVASNRVNMPMQLQIIAASRGHVDNEYLVDYSDILKTVRRADVVAFRFVTVPERLLVDNRFTEVDPPMVRLVPQVTSAEERFKSLKVLRPRRKLPHQS